MPITTGPILFPGTIRTSLKLTGAGFSAGGSGSGCGDGATSFCSGVVGGVRVNREGEKGQQAEAHAEV
jgi:hypothetical protein